MRRGCITGCVVVLVLCAVLLAAAVWSGFAVRAYIAAMPPDQAPCAMMSIGLRVLGQGIEHPGAGTTPEQLDQMRRTQAQLQEAYDHRCSSP
jgi:hypothetical protein